MRKSKTVVYKTHPVYKALTWLMLTFTVAALLFAWAVYADAKIQKREYESVRAACEYEAYLSFFDAIDNIASEKGDVREESRLAAESLSRFVMFSESKADTGVLRELLLDGGVDPTLAMEISRIAESSDTPRAAIERAAEAVKAHRIATHGSDERAREGEWSFMSLPEVKERSARELAERVIGGGGEVRLAESHSYPPVYSYVNGNATAEVTRMGGRLIRMCKFPLGTAEVRGDGECLLSAEAFLKTARITGTELSSVLTEKDSVTYVFSSSDGGREITVKVSRQGASVIFFDAYGYYKSEPKT